MCARSGKQRTTSGPVSEMINQKGGFPTRDDNKYRPRQFTIFLRKQIRSWPLNKDMEHYYSCCGKEHIYLWRMCIHSFKKSLETLEHVRFFVKQRLWQDTHTRTWQRNETLDEWSTNQEIYMEHTRSRVNIGRPLLQSAGWC